MRSRRHSVVVAQVVQESYRHYQYDWDLDADEKEYLQQRLGDCDDSTLLATRLSSSFPKALMRKCYHSCCRHRTWLMLLLLGLFWVKTSLVRDL